MANVDAEQNAAPTQQPEDSASSESITLSEENLEALLRGVSGTAPLPKPAAAPLPVPAGAAHKPSHLDQATKIEPAKKEVPLASLASRQEAPPLEAVPPPPFEASPVAVTPLQSAPQAAPQPDVNSKLALISAIKQRRAVSVRPEAPASEPEISAPLAPAVGPREEGHEGPEPVVEHAAPDVESEAEEEVAAAPKAGPASSSRPTAVADAPVAPRATKVVTEIQPQKGLPAKKVWTNGAVAAPSEREARRSEPLRTEMPQPEAARKAAPKATVAAPPAETPDAPESQELFAAFGSGIPQQDEAKPKSFLTSKAGMGVIGGAIAAATLAVYFLTAHGSPKKSATVNTPAAPPVEVSSTVAPSAPSPDVKTTAPAPAANQHTPAAPVAAQVAGAKPAFAAQAAGQPAAQQIPAANLQRNSIAQQSAVSQPATPESPRTVARAFTAPTAARPASSPVVDAAPALAINTATPAGVALPARIAPLPPPPVAPAPAQAAAPRQLNVSGAAQAAKLTRQVVPQYPAVAKAARVQGTVHFRALIGTDGAVKALTTLGGPLPLAQAAADAVKQWRYQPTLVDGKPVEVTTQIDVAFTL
jgi:TonB family protein